jgi:hypothetical protein
MRAGRARVSPGRMRLRLAPAAGDAGQPRTGDLQAAGEPEDGRKAAGAIGREVRSRTGRVPGLTCGPKPGVHVLGPLPVPGHFPGRGGPGGRRPVTVAASRASVTMLALPGQVRAARVRRRRARPVLPACGRRRAAGQRVVTNSVRHSGSAVPGGLVTVTVTAGDQAVRVEVTDRSAGRVPVLLPAAGDQAEGSRGYGWWTRRRPGGGASGAAGSRRPGSSCGTAGLPRLSHDAGGSYPCGFRGGRRRLAQVPCAVSCGL